MGTARNSLPAFAAWALAGVVAALGLLTITVPGLLVAALTGVVALVLFVRLASPYAALGLAAGAAVPLFYVAWLNREGPGRVCHALGATGQECADQYSPWPWLVVGLALLAAAGALYVAARRHRWGTDPGH